MLMLPMTGTLVSTITEKQARWLRYAMSITAPFMKEGIVAQQLMNAQSETSNPVYFLTRSRNAFAESLKMQRSRQKPQCKGANSQE
jgi:hypothetical protein